MNDMHTMRTLNANSGISQQRLGSGGSPTLVQKLYGFANWKMGVVVLVSLILLLLGYYTYKHYANSKTTFNANREHIHMNENSNKTATLMLFYVDWCPHCKTAKPEWEELKALYEGKQINGYTISFDEYNCTNETEEVSELMNKYNIEGYPTIKLLKDNQIIEYDAKPTKSTMEQFLNTVL
jgi:thiol-disulfide isomerase/thioredoxin